MHYPGVCIKNHAQHVALPIDLAEQIAKKHAQLENKAVSNQVKLHKLK